MRVLRIFSHDPVSQMFYILYSVRWLRPVFSVFCILYCLCCILQLLPPRHSSILEGRFTLSPCSVGHARSLNHGKWPVMYSKLSLRFPPTYSHPRFTFAFGQETWECLNSLNTIIKSLIYVWYEDVDKASVSCDWPAYNLPPRLPMMWDRAPPSKCYCLLEMPTTCHWASSLLVNRPTWVFWLFLHPPDNAGTLQFDRVSYFCSKWCLFSSLWSIPALQSVFLHTWRGKDISWHGHCLLNGQVGSLTINSGRGIFSQRNQRKNNSLTE